MDYKCISATFSEPRQGYVFREMRFSKTHSILVQIWFSADKNYDAVRWLWWRTALSKWLSNSFLLKFKISSRYNCLFWLFPHSETKMFTECPSRSNSSLHSNACRILHMWHSGRQFMNWHQHFMYSDICAILLSKRQLAGQLKREWGGNSYQYIDSYALNALEDYLLYSHMMDY